MKQDQIMTLNADKAAKEIEKDERQTCLVNDPPRFIRPDPDLFVCSHNITVDVSL